MIRIECKGASSQDVKIFTESGVDITEGCMGIDIQMRPDCTTTATLVYAVSALDVEAQAQVLLELASDQADPRPDE